MEPSERRSSRPKSRQSLAHIPSRTQSEPLDIQNATTDLSAHGRIGEQKLDKSKKRGRGKSLGPGGLEALQETSGNANKTTSLTQPRSILKPTVPLTPPKHIPSFDELKKKNSEKTKSATRSNAEDLLIDFSTPAPSREEGVGAYAQGATADVDPFSPLKNNLSFDKNVENVKSIDAEEEKRLAEKEAILEKRAARRKSMANRRVSFAPEATLHTWSVMELQEDSTTSSASNSTRRQSSMTTAQSPAVRQNPDATVSQQTTDVQKVSEKDQPPARQRRSRNSILPTEDEITENSIYSSSPSGDVTADSSPVRVEDSIDSESDSDGDTAMSMDDMTSQTVNSQDSNTQSSLDDRLRQAASQAGTRGIEYDENGDDLTMEMADGTVTNAFRPWVDGQNGDQAALQDQENIDPRLATHITKGGSLNAKPSEDETQEITMEMTRAVGTIVTDQSPSKNAKQSSSIKRRRSSMKTRRTSVANSDSGDEAMDMTMVAGGILSSAKNTTHPDEEDITQDMTMEFTRAVGGLELETGHDRRTSMFSTVSDDNETMDMTTAFGGILDPIEEQTEPQTDFEDEKTAAMDMTRAVGKIIVKEAVQQAIDTTKSETANLLPMPVNTEKTTTPTRVMRHRTSVASATGSPSLALKPRLSARPKTRQSDRSLSSPEPTSSAKVNKLSSPGTRSTPQKQFTPLPVRAATPERTPIIATISHRSASPKKLFQREIEARASPGLKKSQGHNKDPLFSENLATGQQTPKYVLHAPKPHQHLRRRSSGIGIDKEGFGSPRISALLDRRSSINDAAPEFHLETKQKSNVKFDDPVQLEKELDAERADEERRESGKFVMEREADERQEENATLQLRELISCMTPKKNNVAKLKGRKSLAVGSARGLLGKRPAELDDEDEDNGSTTPKRLKTVSREGSPVKAIHLPKPPTKEETTGRLTRAQRLALDFQDGQQTPKGADSPGKKLVGPSPHQVMRHRDPEPAHEQIESFEERLDNVIGAIDPSTINPEEAAEEKISLQDFLNMTNIHFIELSTTKRRHTTVQSTAQRPSQDLVDQSQKFAASFVSAATTVPLLELYQHATRELKSYISSGRKIIRSIEAETLSEQPPLFREYLEARPDVKIVMDNQFRNGKSNARLQSKEGWYTWRSQLVDGLRNGLQRINADMEHDSATLNSQQASVNDVLSSLRKDNANLQQEIDTTQMKLAHINSVNHQELKSCRQSLQSADEQLADKVALLDTLRQQMQDKGEALDQASELRTELQDQIMEADRVREEHRGWVANDVLALKSKVDAITKATGWSILSADFDENTDTGVTLTLAYKNKIQLYFHPAAFENSQSRRSSRRSKSLAETNAPIALSLIAPGQENRSAASTDRRFFLQYVSSQLHELSVMPSAMVTTKRILQTASKGWDFADNISEEIRLLNMVGLTQVSIQDNKTLVLKVMVLLNAESRVDIEFALAVREISEEGVSSSVSINVGALYGPVTSLLDASKIKKVQSALSKEIENKDLGVGALVGAVHGFKNWCRAQNKPKEMFKSSPTKTSTRVDAENVSEESTQARAPPSPHVKRSPLAIKKSSTLQKKALPVPMARPYTKPAREISAEKLPDKGKENVAVVDAVNSTSHKPAIPPEMQEAMMQHTPIKRIGALRRSPIGGSGGGW